MSDRLYRNSHLLAIWPILNLNSGFFFFFVADGKLICCVDENGNTSNSLVSVESERHMPERRGLRWYRAGKHTEIKMKSWIMMQKPHTHRVTICQFWTWRERKTISKVCFSRVRLSHVIAHYFHFAFFLDCLNFERYLWSASVSLRGNQIECVCNVCGSRDIFTFFFFFWTACTQTHTFIARNRTQNKRIFPN